MNAREVIAAAFPPEPDDPRLRSLWEVKSIPDKALAALAEAGFVVVACPPGGRVVVSRESKPCPNAANGCEPDSFHDACEVCGGSGVVEATTIHGERPDVSAVFDEVIAYVHTHKRYKALTDDEKMRAALEVLVGDAFASKGWAAVALPEETPQ